NLTGVIPDVPGETPVSFDVEFTGTGHGYAFELQFVDNTSGALLGSIPVTINQGYFYLVEAIDPDGDDIEYILLDGPEHAVMDPETARISWTPPAPGDYPFHIRVEDGRGGFDEQKFVVTVTDS